MDLKPLRAALVLLAGLAGMAARSPAQSVPPADAPPIGLAELARLDHLPRLRSSVRVASVSSYDRTDGNDDGFSGRYSYVRKEGDALVVADLKGPGVIYRIWTPTPTDDPMEFYFDGEAQPRLKLTFRQLFDGTRPPFVAPLSGFGSGGFYTYLPLPYRVSCKVVMRAPRLQFIQINYATYPPDAAFETFSPSSPDLTGPAMERARALLGTTGQNVSAHVVPEGARLKTAKAARRLEPGRAVTLFETKRGGRIAGLRLRPAAAFAGKDRAVLLRVFWDGAKEPAILCPVGDFFGYAWGQPAARSLLVGTDGDTCYAYFPMPFDRAARVELVSEKRDGPPLLVEAEVIHADLPRRKDEGRFYAVWRRENPAQKGRPFNYVEVEGRGHLVGVALQAQGPDPGGTPFFEGDDQATIDGELAIHGTGSEDFFNGGWYDVPGRWEGRASYPLSGCLDYSRPQARSGGYRLFLTDAYAFHRSLKLDMEHAPTGNDLPTDYAGVSYLYLERPASIATVPEAAARVVRDPERLVFTPGWYLPIHSFSIQNATLTKKVERVGGAEHRFLSMHADGEDVFGPHSLAFLCSVPAAGRYRVSVEAMTGPGQGIVQLFQNERATGDPQDFFAAQRGKSGRIAMGVVEMQEGPNQIFFKLMGKNEKAEGMGLDLVTLLLERVP